MKILLVLLLFVVTGASASDYYVYKGKVYSDSDLKLDRTPRVSGKVMQTISAGVLVMTDDLGTLERGNIVLLRNIRGRADGDEAYDWAMPGALFEYITVLGAKSTVRSYEPLPLAPKWQVDALLKEREERQKQEREAKAVKDAQIAAEEKEAAGLRAAEAKKIAEAKKFAVDAKVAALYRKRADSGDADAQYELGLRYLAGKGVAKDEKEGRRFLELAAKQGHKQATAKLKTLS